MNRLGADRDAGKDPTWAWARYEPGAERPWDLGRAAHLLRRAGFGATWDELQKALREGPHRTIDRMLRPDADVDGFNGTHDADEAAAAGSANANPLRAWWLRRMLQTPHPLLEKMVLFWHGHFAVSNERVGSARLMCDHMQHLRRHALGALGPMVEGIAADPAVLLGLDAGSSRRARPDENFPRWFLGAFTLGPGIATNTDVQEAARAFTGRFVLRGRLRHFPREHDGGVKRILAREGAFDAGDVARIAVDHPATARHIVRKLYRWFIAEDEDPDDALLTPIVEPFARDRDVCRLVEGILRSNLFFSRAAYRRRVRSPVEFALGIVKGLEGMVSTTQLADDLAGIGQNLYHPPTAKGWAGGKDWIDGGTVAARSHLARALLAGTKPYGNALDPLAVAERHGHTTPDAAGRWFLDLFVQGDAPAGVAETLLDSLRSDAARGDRGAALRRFVHAVVTLPEFQLA